MKVANSIDKQALRQREPQIPFAPAHAAHYCSTAAGLKLWKPRCQQMQNRSVINERVRVCLCVWAQMVSGGVYITMICEQGSQTLTLD